MRVVHEGVARLFPASGGGFPRGRRGKTGKTGEGEARASPHRPKPRAARSLLRPPARPGPTSARVVHRGAGGVSVLDAFAGFGPPEARWSVFFFARGNMRELETAGGLTHWHCAFEALNVARDARLPSPRRGAHRGARRARLRIGELARRRDRPRRDPRLLRVGGRARVRAREARADLAVRGVGTVVRASPLAFHARARDARPPPP